jgi:hypothetical protein
VSKALGVVYGDGFGKKQGAAITKKMPMKTDFRSMLRRFKGGLLAGECGGTDGCEMQRMEPKGRCHLKRQVKKTRRTVSRTRRLSGRSRVPS